VVHLDDIVAIATLIERLAMPIADVLAGLNRER
jgi:hypothetical protein